MITKVIRLDLDYPSRALAPNPDGRRPTPQEVSIFVIGTAIARSEMAMPEVHMWRRIQDVMLNSDGQPRTGEIELSEDQFDFIYRRLAEGHYPAGHATVVSILMEHWERWKLGVVASNGARERTKSRI